MPPKKKGGKKAAAWDSDDDKVVDPLAAAAGGGGGSDSDAVPAPARPAAVQKKKKKGGGGGGAAAAFALLAADEGGSPSDEDEPEASPSPVAAAPPAPAFALPVEGDDESEQEPSPSPPRRAPATAFAALAGDDDDDESEEEEEAEASPSGTGLVAALVLDVAKHPGADKLSVASLDAGGPAPVCVVTNAKEIAAGQVVVLAPVGATTESGTTVTVVDMRGVQSNGMLCNGAGAGWTAVEDGALARLAPGTAPGSAVPSTPPPGALFGDAALALAAEEKAARKAAKAAAKAAKKASANGSAASLATAEGGGDAASALDLAGAKKKKKKTASADVEAALAAMAAGGGGDAPQPADGAAAVAAELAGAKKPKKKSSSVDVGALLADIGGGGEGDAAAPPPSKKEKKDKKDKKEKDKKKKGSASAEPEPAAPAPPSAPEPEPTGDDEIDALLASIEAPDPPAGGGGGGGKKKKKKGGGGGPAPSADADDLDAALAELGIDVPDAPAAKPAAEPKAETSADGGGGEGGDDGDAAPKELTAAQKKKLKAKAKAKAAKAARASGEGGEGGGEGGEDDGPAAAPAPAAGGGGGGGKKKGPSAAVRRLQEELERRAAAEAAARAEEEARIAAEEAALAEAEAEAARKAAEAEARKQRQKERRAELKKAGLLLTGKAKAEAARLAAVREQFLRNAEGGGDDGASAAPPVKKKAVYEKKKKAAPAAKSGGESAPLSTATSDAAGAAGAAAEEEPQPPSPSPPPADEAPATSTAPASESEPEEDWDALDPEAVKLLPAAAAAQAAAEERARAAAERERAAAEAAAARAALAAAQAEDDGEDSEDGSDGDDESASDSESGASSFSSMDTDEELERRVDAQKARRAARFEAARAAADPNRLRAPICCILGHVDTGKTKLLDNVRRTAVQEGEAGGITQQIGATYIPGDAIARRTAVLGPRSLGGGGGAQAEDAEAARTGADGAALTEAAAASGLGLDLALPGLLVIDTPGHESFSNLRSRGSGLCDIAILVVDLMHGLEPQTLESIALLKMRKTPFIVALNKVDRLFGWAPVADAGFRDALAAQADHVRREFADRLAAATLALNEQGLNVAPYWANPDPRKYVNIVPTSAITGEGVADLLALLVRLTQTRMADRLKFVDEPQATVLEVKVIEGLGTTVDVVLVNGTLREGDTVVACGLHGPLVATVRSLLTPHPLKELRVKGSYVHHKAVQAAQGVKIAAHGLESAVAGTQLLILGKGDDVDALKAEAMEDMHDIFASVDRTGDGVCAQASTLGSLEALLEFLKSPEVSIPVAGIAIGPVHKRDVMRASIMRERGVPKFACVLAFDVPVTREAGALADELGVRVFTADIIYHLFDQFKAYLAQCKADEQAAAKAHAAFPCVLKILPTCIFNKKDPIVLGVEVEEGIAAVGTPVCVPSREGGLDLGKIASLELNHKPVDRAHRGDAVAMKIESTCAVESARMFGRHFDANDRIVSRISRRSIDVLKTHFRDDLGRDDWVLVVKLKKLFGIE